MKISDTTEGMSVIDTMFPKQIGKVVFVGEGFPDGGGPKKMLSRVEFDMDGGKPGTEHSFEYFHDDDDDDTFTLTEVKA